MTDLRLLESKLATPDTSGSSAGRNSSFNVAAVGSGFFSTVSTCFRDDESKDFTSHLASALSTEITGRGGIITVYPGFHVELLII